MEAKEHNYIRKVEELAARLRPVPGRVYPVEVVHEDSCGLHAGRLCDCDCQVRLAGAGKS